MSAINITKRNFQEEVIHAEQPVLVDFWAPWCAPCRSVLPLVEEIAGERSDIKVAKVNIQEQPELAKQYKVISIPTLMVFEGGKIVNRSMGAKPKHEILELLNS